MTTKTVGRGWCVLILLCAIVLAGCGGGLKRVPVAGTVTLDGKPLNSGMVIFSPDTSKENKARINCSGWIAEGRYELHTRGVTNAETGSGVPLGWYKVTWMNPKQGARKLKQEKAEVNEKYQNVEKTPLMIEVKDNAAPGDYDVKLTK